MALRSGETSLSPFFLSSLVINKKHFCVQAKNANNLQKAQTINNKKRSSIKRVSGSLEDGRGRRF